MTYPVVSSGRLPVEAIKKVKGPDPHEKCIAGLHVEETGEVGVVWLSHDLSTDKVTGKVTLWDSVLFPAGAHFSLIAEGLRQRGDWKPCAWRLDDEEYVEELRKRGCKFIHEGYEETPTVRTVTVLKLDERLAAETFKVVETNERWLREFQDFSPKGGVIPAAGFPLMSATRHALHCLKSARAQDFTKRRREVINWGGSRV